MNSGACVWLAVLAFWGIAHASAAQTGALPTLRSVQAAVEGEVTVVTVTADGPLPAPASGIAEKPPARLFFDFTGINPLPGDAGKMVQLPGAGAVARIRVALFSAGPNVTRVVLDLKHLEPFAVSVGDQVSGRIRIAVGAPATATPADPATIPPPAGPQATTPPPAMVAPPVPPPPPLAKQAQPAPAAPVPLPPSPTRRGVPQPEAAIAPFPPPVMVETYRRQLSDTVERLESLRLVIGAIDLERYVTVRTLDVVGNDLKTLQARLEAAKPSAELRPTHDLLLASCALGANAVTLRLEAERRDDATGRRNAASAAAGALMLLDRACVVLGCAPKK